jgi:hypothetical protein
MKIIYLAGLSLAATSLAMAPGTGHAAAAAEPPACKSLRADYEEASKRMAMNHAQGIGDNSAVRATRRETENNTILAEARLTLDLLKGNGCRLPTSAASYKRYYSSGLRCHNDILKVKLSGTYSFPASCRRADWVPDAQ